MIYSPTLAYIVIHSHMKSYLFIHSHIESYKCIQSHTKSYKVMLSQTKLSVLCQSVNLWICDFRSLWTAHAVNKPSFCSGSCDEIHATTKSQIRRFTDWQRTLSFVWLSITLYDFVWLYMTMYEYVWLHMTVYDYICQCRTIYHFV